MAISQVITFGGSPDQLVWKYGDENITTTSQLIVDETHEALLVVNGNAADLFGPGTRTLNVPNIPLVNKILSIPTGGANPFPCKVFYINKVHHLDLLWGTQGAIALEDPDYQIFLHVMLHGSVAISVGDSRKFMLKLVGFRKSFDPEDVVTNFRGLISSHVKDCISKIMINGKVSFFQMNANLLDISNLVKERLEQIFDEYGVIIHYFNIESIDVPENDYKAITEAKNRRASRIIEGYSWQEEQQMEVANTFAGNEGTMGAMGGMMGGMMGGAVMGSTIAQMARSAMDPNRIPNAAPPHDVRSAVQTGGAQNLRDLMGGQVSGPGVSGAGGFQVDTDFGAQPPQPAPGPASAAPAQGGFCPKCGSPTAPDALFCSRCGNPLAKACPNCGAPADPGALFCSKCGTRL